MRTHRPATIPGLPPFTAGAVGYFAYDSVRQLEKIGERANDDLALPDCELMFFDRLLAFDHLRHQIHIVANADVSDESPKKLTNARWQILRLGETAGQRTSGRELAESLF